MPDDAPRAKAPAGNLPHVPVAGRRLVLAACLMATFMAAVESSIIATAIPTLVGDLGGFSLFSWVFTVYLLTQAVSIPIYGRLADLHGRKKVFFFGAGLFLAGSTLCGFAWGMVPLICFRALQGFGAGAVQPIAATILGDIYTPAERAKVQGLVASVFGVSAVVGPSLGAFLIEHMSWPVVFWVNLPIGALAIVMIAVFLREHVQPRPHQIDWLGSLLLLVAISTLLLALVQGGTFSRFTLAVVSASGIAALAALYLHERTTREPMLPLELWRIRVIVVGSLGNGSAGAVMTGVAAFLPTYVQGAMGRSALAGGLVLGAMSVSWALASIVGGRIMVRTSYRLVASLGGALLVAGCLILVLLTPANGPVWAAAGSFVIGIGMGFCSTVFIVSVQASVPWHQRGAATSSTMFLRFIGQSIGVAGCGAVLNATVLHLDPAAVAKVASLLDPTTRSAMTLAELANLTHVVAQSLHNAYLLATAFAVATLVIALQLPARLSPVHEASGH
ncbi:MDR family MFS transporter [Rhodopila sp.]|uniref:MDR family MFS transporter n=1 Tax=Rhodopila sp. TaxID=2480087 RepID=UPI003D0B99C6